MKFRTPLLIPGHQQKQFFRDRKNLEIQRWAYPLRMARLLAEDTAKRIHESRKQFPWKFFRGDCHSHTDHSDGRGTVAETAEMVKAAGLDFQFVTDHWGVTQAPECKKYGLWVGQEPVTQHHHLGILGLHHAFAPKMDFLADYAEAKRRGAFVFVPHPAGWWATTVYKEEQKQILEKLPSPFLMEICNGANNIVTAWDFLDDSAIRLWDKLLCRGKVVHAMGNTDAHAPHCIGMIWNSVFSARCQQKAILQSLSKGHSFVSNGPLVHIQLGKARMGEKSDVADRKTRLKMTLVDSRKLIFARVVADGKVILSWNLDEKTKFEAQVRIPKSVKKYVRVEVRSRDAARGYSNPIYFS